MSDKQKKLIRSAVLLLLLLLGMGGCSLGDPDQQFTVSSLDIRGLLFVTEIHWSGSIDNSGNNSDPDDDFIELYNSHEAPLNIGGWSVVISGSVNMAITIPQGTVLEDGKFYTIGRQTTKAFSTLDYVYPDFSLPNAPFAVSIQDGAGKESDMLDFRGEDGNFTYIFAGANLPSLKKSAVRILDSYGVGQKGDKADSWFTYSTNKYSYSQQNIRTAYQDAVRCSPGVENLRSGF